MTVKKFQSKLRGRLSSCKRQLGFRYCFPMVNPRSYATFGTFHRNPCVRIDFEGATIRLNARDSVKGTEC